MDEPDCVSRINLVLKNNDMSTLEFVDGGDMCENTADINVNEEDFD